MKALLVALAFLFGVPKVVSAQVNGCYNYLTFQEFQKFYTPADQVYLKSLYKTIKYPPISRENNQEGIVRVQLINHSLDSLENVVSGSNHQYLLEETTKQVTNVCRENIENNDTQFMTNFYVKYDIQPFEEMDDCNPYESEDCDYIYILAYPPIIKY